MQEPDFFYRTSNRTDDADAIRINDALNDVRAKIEVGRQLAAVYRGRFRGDGAAFRRWIRMNLDVSCKSVARYICLSRNADLLEELGVIDLIGAYRLTGCNGNLNNDHDAWQVPA